MATRTLTRGDALVAAFTAAVARGRSAAGRRCRSAIPAGTGLAAAPRVIPLYPPLPDAPGEAAVGRRAQDSERATLPPEAVVGLLGH